MSDKLRKVISVVLVGLVASLGSVSCSSTPETEDDETATEAPDEPDVVEMYGDAARWLPADSIAVAAGGGQTIFEALGDRLLPTALPEATAGELGTVRGLRDDIELVLRDEFDFAWTRTDTVAVGVTLDGGGAVLFGEFDEPQRTADAEIADYPVWNLDSAVPDGELPVDVGLYATLVDEPRPALVLGTDLFRLEQVVDDSSGSLAMSETGEDFEAMFDEVRGAYTAVAVEAGDLTALAGDDIPAPDAAVVGYRPDELRATLRGSHDELEQIEAMAAEFLSEARDEIEREYEESAPGTGERLTLVYARHLAAALDGQLHPELDDRHLRYQLELTEAQHDPSTAVVVGAGIAAALAIPAFQQYQSRATQSEADALIQQMGSGARAYFEGDQIFSTPDGPEPWHVADEDSDSRPGMPVPFDEKVFPGGPDIKVVSSPRIPEDGEQVATDPQIVSGDVDFDADAVFPPLGISLPETTRFRYVYETGPGTGADATATIRAEANFDPTTPKHHTVTLELYVGSDFGAKATPTITEHEDH